MPDKVELPDGCIITDRRTWQKQQKAVVRLESENRRMAGRLQLLTKSNEALRERIAEAEEIAVDSMTQVEEIQVKLDEAKGRIEKIGRVKRALRLSRDALDRVYTGLSHQHEYGGTIGPALRAVKKAQDLL